jgi:membrane-associated phospholipid phosphatase
MRVAVLILTAFFALPTCAHGQNGVSKSRAAASADGHAGDDPTSRPSLFSQFVRNLKQLPSENNTLIFAIGGTLAVAAHAHDRELTRRAAQAPPLDELVEFGGITGDAFVQVGFAAGTLLTGRAIHQSQVEAVGADLVQAQLLTGLMTRVLKSSVHRTRPDGGRSSFPSGHASASLANATVLARHFGWKVAIPAYSVAACIGLSRLQENRHYPSDVIFGATVGLIAGRTVTITRAAHSIAVAPVVLNGGAGMTVVLSR